MLTLPYGGISNHPIHYIAMSEPDQPMPGIALRAVVGSVVGRKQFIMKLKLTTIIASLSIFFCCTKWDRVPFFESSFLNSSSSASLALTVQYFAPLPVSLICRYQDTLIRERCQILTSWPFGKRKAARNNFILIFEVINWQQAISSVCQDFIQLIK